MIYLKSEDGTLRLIILESANLDEIRKGRPAHTPDKSVLIAWTPDPVWLADRITDAMKRGGDLAEVARLIDQSRERPEAPPRPYHEPTEVHRDSG